MSKKAKLYLLVVINLIAWGYVGYKVYKALEGDEDIELSNKGISYNKIKTEEKTDSVKLILNYTDPFLKNGNFNYERKNTSSNTFKNQNTQTKSNPASNNVVKTTPTPTIQPTVDIKYLGLVKNNTTGIQTALISVNGKSMFVKLKDIVEGYTISEISSESILAKKGKEKIYFRK